MGELSNLLWSIPGIPTVSAFPSSVMQDTTMPLRCCLLLYATAVSSDDLIFCRFKEIVITSPLSHVDGVVSARVETCIKLDISFYPGSSVEFLKLPKTPSVHSDCDAPEQSLKFSLEVRRAAGGDIIQTVCSTCKKRKDQATLDIVDFRAQSTTVTNQNEFPNKPQDEFPNKPQDETLNGAASIEFFIKCYAKHHGVDHHAFR